MTRKHNLRRRGNSWVVHFRVNGKQVWKSFADREHGGEKGAREAAQLYLERARVQVRERTFRAPVNATMSEALDEWLRFVEQERQVKPSTLREYRSVVETHLRPAFGSIRVHDLATETIDAWRRRLLLQNGLSPRTVNKLRMNLHGVMERARKRYGLGANPVADVEPIGERRTGALDFYSPEEVMALVRAAASERDAALFLSAAFTGLRRGELVALRWRDVDFAGEAIRVRASFTHGSLTSPKSGKVRTVPMVPQVAQTLARLHANPSGDELVFPGERGKYLDASALRRRFDAALKRAELRPLRFHDLRHVFGSLAIDRASIVEVQEWMGHADIETTRRYLHFKSRSDAAALLAEAFECKQPASRSVPHGDISVPNEDASKERDPVSHARSGGTDRQEAEALSGFPS
jgi:integrase